MRIVLLVRKQKGREGGREGVCVRNTFETFLKMPTGFALFGAGQARTVAASS